MSRTQPTEIREHPLLPTVDEQHRVRANGHSYFASYSRRLEVTGWPWVREPMGRYVVLPRTVELTWTQTHAGAEWRVTSVQVTGPARWDGLGAEVGGDLTTAWSWGELGSAAPTDVPLFVAEQLLRWHPAGPNADVRDEVGG
jgi:hypothetical protein